MKSQPHLKGDLSGLDMYGSIVVVMNIGKNIIPCSRVIRIVHVHNMHNHPVEDLVLAICLGWKEVDLVSLVSNSDQRLDQNVLRNRLS
jgi:hypothetical protein